MGFLAYSLLWVMQDLDHKPYGALPNAVGLIMGLVAPSAKRAGQALTSPISHRKERLNFQISVKLQAP